MEELSELDVLVVDCQTTGASPAYGSVLELGWGVARASVPVIRELQAHWVMLPPGDWVDFQVRRLTGFDEAKVESALEPKLAWEQLRASTHFARRIPAAIHFAKFELAFLRDWAERFEPNTTFPLEAVCLHAIACRLYPDLPRRSLRALAGYLGHGVDPARRCLGHVEATAFIWRKMVAELAARGVHRWDELDAWLTAPPPARSRSKKRRYPLSSSKYRELPDEPGVYRFVRSNGDVLYVGKAMSLRKRVTSHFTGGWSMSERALEMLTQVHDIQATRTPTALEAALLENEDIKERRPPYNVQLVGADPRAWFCNSHLDDVTSEPDPIHQRGPLPSTFSVLSLGAIQLIASGKSATAALRARAVGAPEAWAPDDAAFAEGFASFVKNHSLDSSSDLHQSLVAAARKLLATKSEALPAEQEPDLEEGKAPEEAWDPARVVRHLERALSHGYQLLQRARWLCLLHESDVVFREPTIERTRLLRVRNGHVVEAREVLPDEVPVLLEPLAPLCERKLGFDRNRYDRLRTLTTELKRVSRDGGTAAVRLGPRRWLHGGPLDAILRWV